MHGVTMKIGLECLFSIENNQI